MAGLAGRSGPPGNQNAFRHGLAGIAQRDRVVCISFLRQAEDCAVVLPLGNCSNSQESQ